MSTYDFRILPEHVMEAINRNKPGVNRHNAVTLAMPATLHARLSLAATVYSAHGESVHQQDLVRAALDIVLNNLGITEEYAYNNSPNKDLAQDSEHAQMLASGITPEQYAQIIIRMRDLPRLHVAPAERMQIHAYVTVDSQTYLSITNYLNGMDENVRPSLNEVLRQGLELVTEDLGITLPYRNQLRNMRWLTTLFGKTITDWGRLAFYYYCSEHNL